MKKIFTIGTSNRSLKEFIEILKKYDIKIAVDVRSFPQSRKFPHFGREELSKNLEASGIRYIYLGRQLGGFRRGGYVKYMETEEFKEGIEKLEKIAEGVLTVFFCCEKLFFRCHRRFISAVLLSRGWKVCHIIEINKVYEEPLRLFKS